MVVSIRQGYRIDTEVLLHARGQCMGPRSSGCSTRWPFLHRLDRRWGGCCEPTVLGMGVVVSLLGMGVWIWPGAYQVPRLAWVMGGPTACCHCYTLQLI